MTNPNQNAPVPNEPPFDPEIDGPVPAQEQQGEEMIGATGDAQGDSTLDKDPSDWVSGDEPMTEAQKSYLDTLAKQAGEQLPANLTKAQASEHIDRLKKATGN